MLKHHGAIGSGAADRLPVDAHLAGIERFQAGDHLEQRGLAASARAEQADELAGADRQVHAVERHHRPPPAVARVGLTSLEESRSLDYGLADMREGPSLDPIECLREQHGLGDDEQGVVE